MWRLKGTSHHRTFQGYSSGRCTLGWLHTRWRTRLLAKEAEKQEWAMGKNNTQRKFLNILSDTAYDQDVLVCIMLEVCSW